jgi:hypothetical protein
MSHPCRIQKIASGLRPIFESDLCVELEFDSKVAAG